MSGTDPTPPPPGPDGPDPLRTPPPAAVPVVLAFGANLGDRAATLDAAVAELGAVDGIRIRAVSAFVQTAAVGGPPQPDYLNAVALAETTLAPLDLLDVCHQVEARHGRSRTVRWGPRTLDVDIILYGDLRSDRSDLELPHPRVSRRAFVLTPWLEVDPAAVMPGPDGPQPVADLLLAAPDRSTVRPWLGPGPETTG
ncbi:MAG: 2-amino-4-hydroxy-6-hydroxymethyldihydropteridine diphosphokinase [Kineosporiaceae bacterium]|jgi:dihydroneopterin aldolase / 2-amino-4-hydroxy-6-hydroxymethyldihydropteridine diphosphokinase